MNKNTLLLIGGIILVTLGALLASDHLKNADIITRQNERKQKNVLQALIDSTGNRYPFMNERLKGKIVVINVWATWCGPCLAEIPELNKLAEDFKSDSVVFIGLDDEDYETEQKAITRQAINFNYELFFSQGPALSAIKPLILPGEGGIPVNLVLNQEGKLEIFYTGNQPGEFKKMRAYLEKATNTPVNP